MILEIEEIPAVIEPPPEFINTFIGGVSISKVTGFETDGTPIYALSIEDIEAGIKDGSMQFIDPAS